MPTIICSSRRGCVLIILFQLYGSKAGLFEDNLFWLGHSITASPPPPTSILGEELKYNSMQFLSSLSKIILSQKNCWCNLKDAGVISFFVAI